ncbi:PTS fructose transporter subunit IIA [Clostridium perfringens]|uniref:PTS sugar transporter subunit IIA n=1 Tax=Clostridium perfringens TaxID=1502 RepID=UPI000D95D32D|nr:fructose PTS transporter subunit IIA [Clostridium perfringens]NGU66785.1 PTS transporter subunit EIIA [Clostridium perfringens]PWX09337.1 PTS fructose transporter subunit IIA [Clostridium perfringens]PWX13251.1 PTS fructose transporter subunit IIA [Clostridium perfringens]
MLKELVRIENINLDLKGTTKDMVFDEMINMLDNNEVILDRENFKKDIYHRESLSNTGIGFGIGIPHSKSNFVKKSSIAIGISKKGIEYNSIDGNKVNLVFMLAIKSDDSNLHLIALATISRKLMHEDFRERLLNANSREEIMRVLFE